MKAMWSQGMLRMLKRLKSITSTQLTTSILVVSATIGLAASTTIGTSLFTPEEKPKLTPTLVESKTQSREPQIAPIDLSQIAQEEISGELPTTVPDVTESSAHTSTTKLSPTSDGPKTTSTTAVTTSTSLPSQDPSLETSSCVRSSQDGEFTNGNCSWSILQYGKDVKVELKHQLGDSPQANDDLVYVKTYDAASGSINDEVNFHFSNFTQITVYLSISVKGDNGSYRHVVNSAPYILDAY